MGLGTGWVTRREYCRQDPYFILYFFSALLLSLLSGFIFKSVWKSILGLILAAILRKKKYNQGSFNGIYYTSGFSKELKL